MLKGAKGEKRFLLMDSSGNAFLCTVDEMLRGGRGRMRKGMICKNCEYFKSFGDAMNPRIDGICLKMRLSNIGFVQIHTKETYFCSLFKKPERREGKNE